MYRYTYHNMRVTLILFTLINICKKKFSWDANIFFCTQELLLYTHGVPLTLLLKPFKISTFKNAHWFCTHMVIPFAQCW